MKFLPALFVAALAGCSTTATMDGIMQSWQGANIESVVQQWGYPSEEREFRGRKLYIWNYSKTGFVPGIATTTGSLSPSGTFSAQTVTTGGGVIRGDCSRILEVDSSGTVVKWQWNGNNCPFAEAFEYAKWRNPAASKNR